MKKTVILLAFLLVFSLIFAGCKKEEAAPSEPVFALDSREDIITVTADGASQGSGGVGYLGFEEGEMLRYNLNGSDSKESRVPLCRFLPFASLKFLVLIITLLEHLAGEL